MTWDVIWSERAADDLRRLGRGDPDQARRVAQAVARLATAEQGDVKRLKGQGYARAFRLRVGE